MQLAEAPGRLWPCPPAHLRISPRMCCRPALACASACCMMPSVMPSTCAACIAGSATCYGHAQHTTWPPPALLRCPGPRPGPPAALRRAAASIKGEGGGRGGKESRAGKGGALGGGQGSEGQRPEAGGDARVASLHSAACTMRCAGLGCARCAALCCAARALMSIWKAVMPASSPATLKSMSPSASSAGAARAAGQRLTTLQPLRPRTQHDSLTDGRGCACSPAKLGGSTPEEALGSTL